MGHPLINLFLFLFTMLPIGARAEFFARASNDVDYSWVNKAYFSDDDSRLRNRIHLGIRSDSPHVNKASLISFISGLNDPMNQLKLRRAYRLSNQTYLTLARLAVGIMYAESKFGRHPRYLFKERFPWTVSVAKGFLERSAYDPENYRDSLDQAKQGLELEYEALTDDRKDAQILAAQTFDLSENSRGPTQIKYLPPGFEKLFPGINKDNLHVPQFSSVATLAYLANAISTLRRIATKNNCHVPREYFLQHLIYVYVGSTVEIEDCTATLDKNLYWGRALEIQNDLEAFGLDTPQPLTAENVAKIETIRNEIAFHKERRSTFEQLLRITQKMREERFLVKPEDANAMLEYLYMLGVGVATHHGLGQLKKYFPTFRIWQKKSRCARIILGKKRYYAALHAVNIAVTVALRNEENSLLDHVFEIDDDKLREDELKLLLGRESRAIKRLELDIALFETGM